MQMIHNLSGTYPGCSFKWYVTNISFSSKKLFLLLLILFPNHIFSCLLCSFSLSQKNRTGLFEPNHPLPSYLSKHVVLILPTSVWGRNPQRVKLLFLWPSNLEPWFSLYQSVKAEKKNHRQKRWAAMSANRLLRHGSIHMPTGSILSQLYSLLSVKER